MGRLHHDYTIAVWFISLIPNNDLPALLAAAAYAILASAMPRAVGSYIYASRGLNPYLGFVASFKVCRSLEYWTYG